MILVPNIFYNHLLCLGTKLNQHEYYNNCKYYILRIIVNNKHVFSHIKYNILILYSMIFFGLLEFYILVSSLRYLLITI